MRRPEQVENLEHGIGDVATRKLGDAVTGYLSTIASGQNNNLVDGDANQAQQIVAKAIDEIASMRGRLGAFQKNTIGATVRSLGVAAEKDATFVAGTALLAVTSWTASRPPTSS